MSTQKKPASLDELEKILREKRITYTRDTDSIVSSKKKTSSTGHKTKVSLAIEKAETGEIFGYVHGIADSKIQIDPGDAINEYETRLSILHATD
jgi:ABC-type phosphate transport system auxiliary subunit